MDIDGEDVLPPRVRPAVLPRSWRAEKLFVKAKEEAKKRGKDTLCDLADPRVVRRFRSLARSGKQFRCMRASFPLRPRSPEFASKQVLDDSRRDD